MRPFFFGSSPPFLRYLKSSMVFSILLPFRIRSGCLFSFSRRIEYMKGFRWIFFLPPPHGKLKNFSGCPFHDAKTLLPFFYLNRAFWVLFNHPSSPVVFPFFFNLNLRAFFSFFFSARHVCVVFPSRGGCLFRPMRPPPPPMFLSFFYTIISPPGPALLLFSFTNAIFFLLSSAIILSFSFLPGALLVRPPPPFADDLF